MDSTISISCSLEAKASWITTSLLMVTRNFHIDQVVARQLFSQKQIAQILTWTECQMKSKTVFELQSVGTVSDHSQWRGRAIYRSCQNFSIIGWVSFHLSPFVCVSFITSLQSILCSVLNTQNTTDNNGYYLARTKHDCTSARCISNYSISVTFLR